ncbi:hypothetical protein MMPV_006442 [Pyropia vietnamensis]
MTTAHPRRRPSWRPMGAAAAAAAVAAAVVHSPASRRSRWRRQPPIGWPAAGRPVQASSPASALHFLTLLSLGVVVSALLVPSTAAATFTAVYFGRPRAAPSAAPPQSCPRPSATASATVVEVAETGLAAAAGDRPFGPPEEPPWTALVLYQSTTDVVSSPPTPVAAPVRTCPAPVCVPPLPTWWRWPAAVQLPRSACPYGHRVVPGVGLPRAAQAHQSVASSRRLAGAHSGTANPSPVTAAAAVLATVEAAAKAGPQRRVVLSAHLAGSDGGLLGVSPVEPPPLWLANVVGGANRSPLALAGVCVSPPPCAGTPFAGPDGDSPLSPLNVSTVPGGRGALAPASWPAVVAVAAASARAEVTARVAAVGAHLRPPAWVSWPLSWATRPPARPVSPPPPLEVSNADHALRKKLFNFASVDAGARVLAASEGTIGQKNVIDENRDKYALAPCRVNPRWVVIELSEKMVIHAVEVGHFEFYASAPLRVAVLGATVYPAASWRLLGSWAYRDSHAVQWFALPASALVKYVRVVFLGSVGGEFYCPISIVRVYGKGLVDDFEEYLKGESAGGADGGGGRGGGRPSYDGIDTDGDGVPDGHDAYDDSALPWMRPSADEAWYAPPPPLVPPQSLVEPDSCTDMSPLAVKAIFSPRTAAGSGGASLASGISTRPSPPRLGGRRPVLPPPGVAPTPTSGGGGVMGQGGVAGGRDAHPPDHRRRIGDDDVHLLLTEEEFASLDLKSADAWAGIGGGGGGDGDGSSSGGEESIFRKVTRMLRLLELNQSLTNQYVEVHVSKFAAALSAFRADADAARAEVASLRYAVAESSARLARVPVIVGDAAARRDALLVVLLVLVVLLLVVQVALWLALASMRWGLRDAPSQPASWLGLPTPGLPLSASAASLSAAAGGGRPGISSSLSSDTLATAPEESVVTHEA